MSTVTRPKRPRYKRAPKPRIPVSFNVYDGRVWGQEGDGIRVVFYDSADEQDRNIITAVYLPGMQFAEAYYGIDEWFSTTTLPRRIRRELRSETGDWLKGVLW